MRCKTKRAARKYYVCEAARACVRHSTQLSKILSKIGSATAKPTTKWLRPTPVDKVTSLNSLSTCDAIFQKYKIYRRSVTVQSRNHFLSHFLWRTPGVGARDASRRLLLFKPHILSRNWVGYQLQLQRNEAYWGIFNTIAQSMIPNLCIRYRGIFEEIWNFRVWDSRKYLWKFFFRVVCCRNFCCSIVYFLRFV